MEHNTNKGCCKKCENMETIAGYPTNYTCEDTVCSCHQQKEQTAVENNPSKLPIHIPQIHQPTPSPDGEGWMKEWENRKLGLLEWCGNENHECQCEVKVDEILSFIISLIKEREMIARKEEKDEIVSIIKKIDWEKISDDGKTVLINKFDVLEAIKARSTSERVQ